MTNAEFGDLIRRNPLRVIAGVVAIFSGVGVYLVADRIDLATEVLKQKASEGEKLANNIKYSAQLTEQYEAMVAASNEIYGRVIHASQLANNLQYFYRLETESGVELVDVRQTTAGVIGARSNIKGPTNGVGFSVSVKGNYATLLGWLRRIENGPHYCRIVSASIAPAGLDRTGPLTLSVALELFGQP